ncbi:MAG: hypothetical protein KF815_06225 [Rhodospirillales bacterium]|nr:hypothetical protein [Rhodospirillales bacterium]MDG4575667.1 hypothetical protein [Defluviicoccus sp.]MDG4592185.1 hypothetical protein [Defluviicoccus sp.]MDG4602979.1 hypothetical protein [Defluviicoccus sp.]MDG4608470.1 hypothetical protein [Defluviicoccus sp.]
MRRVLWGHTFDAPDEWASAVRRLADLSDEQINGLPGTPPPAKSESPKPKRPADT